MTYECKNLSTGAVKDVDTKGRRVTGYLSTFDVLDSHNDIMERGAFDKTLQERSDQIFFLNQHNWAEPHGKMAVLAPDQMGLYFESQKLPDTTYSNDVLKLYQEGIMTDHSIGFITVKSDYNEEDQIRRIKEVKLYEGSNVTIGANRNTPFMGLKRDLKDIQDMTKKILKAFRNGTFTDETFNLLEIALKQLQTEAVEYGKSLHQEPSLDTPETQQPIIDTLRNFKTSLQS